MNSQIKRRVTRTPFNYRDKSQFVDNKVWRRWEEEKDQVGFIQVNSGSHLLINGPDSALIIPFHIKNCPPRDLYN